MRPKISRAFRNFSGTTGTLRTGLALLLAVALMGTATVPLFAQAPQTPDASAVESQVKKFGVGKNVKMTLVDGEQVSGHIRSIDTDSFTVKISKTHTERSIPYAQVTFIKDPGPLTWVLVGAAIVIVTILIFHH